MFVHYSDDMILNPIVSSVCIWSNNTVTFPIIKNIYGCESLGEIAIYDDVRIIDLGLSVDDGKAFLAKAAYYKPDNINIIESKEFIDVLDSAICERIIDFIDGNVDRLKKKNVYIFGLNRYTESIIVRLNEKDIVVKGILDNDSKKQGEKFNGISIISPESDYLNDSDAIVLIDIKWTREVEKQLEKNGFAGEIFSLITKG
jgi:hypothetical protein